MGLWISSTGLVKEKENLLVIYDLTFSGGGADLWKTRGMRERAATLETEGRSGNADTD